MALSLFVKDISGLSHQELRTALEITANIDISEQYRQVLNSLRVSVYRNKFLNYFSFRIKS